VIQFDQPCLGNIGMTETASIYGIRVLCDRLMCMNFGTVLVPVTAMLMRPRQMRMRRRPLDCQKDGQQNKIGSRTKV
jgi:hypothetical protein